MMSTIATKILPSGAATPVIGLGVSWSYNEAMNAAKSGNEKLGLGYTDLYLLHAPFAPEHREDAWRAVKDLHEQEILKDIGVSNFSETHLEKLFKTARVKPCVNQVELHSWLMRSSLVKYCKEHDIILQTDSPLARAAKMDDPTLISIAEDFGASPAQVLIVFSLANGFVTLPKSVHNERQLSNLKAANIKLTGAIGIPRLVHADCAMGTRQATCRVSQ
ncbi:hypothetical protein PHMEG_00014891 [Phytophthora megakarya]|uniref:NADP-dependent oxidoreductase domain-containing protein n=1 Tax=Phytophthora megakarya TaxID=4795 RepID=A0A225W568_9STRA|nr:hypothetical protein PHMEG_00014891 [Phytophthora megakarya]